MTRSLTLLLLAALALGPTSAEAAGCVLATDPAGDAGDALERTGPQHDIRRVTAEVTPTSIVFRTTVEQISAAAPPPGTGDAWSVWFMTPEDGEIQVFVHRTYRRDFATTAATDGDPAFDVFFRIDSRTSTVTVEVPYDRLALHEGERLTDVRAYAGPFRGVDLGVGDEGALFGTATLSDEAPSAKSIVVGVGCR